MKELGFTEFAVLRSAVTTRAHDIAVIWESLSWDQRYVVARRYGYNGNLTTDQLVRFYPDMAAYLLGVRLEEA